MVLRHSLLTSGKRKCYEATKYDANLVLLHFAYLIALSITYTYAFAVLFCYKNMHTAPDYFAGSFRINGRKGCTSSLGRYA